MSETQELPIAHDHRGQLLPESERGLVTLSRDADALLIQVDAPFFGDAPPTAPVGATDRLWEHEVCEVFIADDAEHYLEIELSPHGHHLVLELRGVRRVVRSQLPISYSARIEAGPNRSARFRGLARVPWHYLPAVPRRVNAYAIHGSAQQRCYHAHNAPNEGGHVADFHKLGSFVPFALVGCAS